MVRRLLMTEREKHSRLWSRSWDPTRTKDLIKQGFHGGNDIGDWQDHACTRWHGRLRDQCVLCRRRWFKNVTSQQLEGYAQIQRWYRSPVSPHN